MRGVYSVHSNKQTKSYCTVFKIVFYTMFPRQIWILGMMLLVCKKPSAQGIVALLHCFVFLPKTAQISITSFYSIATATQYGRVWFSSFTANINIQVIVQIQLIKSSSVQLNVYELHTAIDNQFSTKHSITNPPSMASKLEESVKPLAFSL